MSSVIQNLLDKTIGDGARASKFECFVVFSNPSIGPSAEDVVALTKTSQFPGKSHDVIDLKYKGRTIPIKGQTKYDNTWTCTFYMTQDHKLKHDFEVWVEALDQQHNMSGSLGFGVKATQAAHGSIGYTTEMKIAQLDFHGSQETVIYTLHNVFPKSVSAIDVDYSQVGTILEVTVEFSYSHFDSEIDKTALGTFADEIKSKAQGAISTAIGSLKGKIAAAIGAGTSGAVGAIGGLFSSAAGLLGGSQAAPGQNAYNEMVNKVE